MIGSENTGLIEITNSTWGHLNASRGFEINVVDCYYTDVRTTIPLLATTFCKVTINCSIFGQDMKHFVGLALLNGTSTNAQMINTSFILGLHRDNDGPVIQVNNKSKLHMENCSVQFNVFVCGSVVVFTKSRSEASSPFLDLIGLLPDSRQSISNHPGFLLHFGTSLRCLTLNLVFLLNKSKQPNFGAIHFFPTTVEIYQTSFSTNTLSHENTKVNSTHDYILVYGEVRVCDEGEDWVCLVGSSVESVQ